MEGMRDAEPPVLYVGVEAGADGTFELTREDGSAETLRPSA